jgi:hypothetical protein
MECARRGLSWKQNTLTLYPASPRVAAAAPPASPVPTMMMSSLRRLAGLTSAASNLRVVHLSAIGPAGALVSATGSPSV